MSTANRFTAGLATAALAVWLAPPVGADLMDSIPGDGVFQVGSDVVPGVYFTNGSGSTFGVWLNGVPTAESMCSWFTYATPDANKENVVQAGTSIGPMYATVPVTVKAFESHNCQPWTRVP